MAQQNNAINLNGSNARTGVIFGSNATLAGLNVDQSEHVHTHNYYGNSSSNVVDGYYPDAAIHDSAARYQVNLTENLADLKALIEQNDSTSNRVIVVHGPVNSGKSTMAHLLMKNNETERTFSNCIWLNAETIKSLEDDFKNLHKEMKKLRNLTYNEGEEVFLKEIYYNLLTHPTLIVFDNAAVVDLDPAGAFTKVYDLLQYLPRRSLLVNGKMTAPTVIITTRAIMNCKDAVFTSLCLRTANRFNLNGSEIQKKLETDIRLTLKHRCGKLASFLFLLISLFGQEKPLLWLLTYACNRVQHIGKFLNLRNPVPDDDVEVALKLLERFAMVEVSSRVVSMSSEVANCGKNVIKASAFFEEKSLVTAIINTFDAVSQQRFFNMDLAELELYAINMNVIILSLYPYMLKYQVSASDYFSTFPFRGNSYEKYYDSLLDVTEILSGEKGRFASSLKTKVQTEMLWARFLLGGITEANQNFGNQYHAPVAVSRLLQGNPKQALNEYFETVVLRILRPVKRKNFELSQAECHMKLGSLSKVSSCIESFQHTVFFNYELPLAVIRAKFLTSQGKHNDAHDLLQKTLGERQRTIGRHSHATAAIEEPLVKLQALQGNFTTALELINHVIAVRRQLLGVTTVRYIESVATKAGILALQGHYPQADELLTKAREDFTSNKRYVYADNKVDDSPHCLILRYHQVKLWYRQQRYNDAANELKAIQPLFYGNKTNIYWFKCQILHAKVFRNTGDLQKSKSFLKTLRKEAVNVFEGLDNHQALKFTLAYAENLVLRGKKEKATKLAQTVLSNASEYSNSLRQKAKCILAEIARLDGTGDEAVSLLQEVVSESIEGSGELHHCTLNYKYRLVGTLLKSPKMNRSILLPKVNALMDPVLELLKSELGEYKETSVMFLSWSLLHAEKLLLFDQVSKASEVLTNLEPLIPASHFMWRRLAYYKAIVQSRTGSYSEAYTSTEKLLQLIWSASVHYKEPDAAEVTGFLGFLSLKMKESQWAFMKASMTECNKKFQTQTSGLGGAKYIFAEEANKRLADHSEFLATRWSKSIGQDLQEVRTLYQLNSNTTAHIFGPNHSRALQTKLNLAAAYGAAGQYTKALEVVAEVESAPGYREGDFEAQDWKNAFLSLQDSQDTKRFIECLQFEIGGRLVLNGFLT